MDIWLQLRLQVTVSLANWPSVAKYQGPILGLLGLRRPGTLHLCWCNWIFSLNRASTSLSQCCWLKNVLLCCLQWNYTKPLTMTPVSGNTGTRNDRCSFIIGDQQLPQRWGKFMVTSSSLRLNLLSYVCYDWKMFAEHLDTSNWCCSKQCSICHVLVIATYWYLFKTTSYMINNVTDLEYKCKNCSSLHVTYMYSIQ